MKHFPMRRLKVFSAAVFLFCWLVVISQAAWGPDGDLTVELVSQSKNGDVGNAAAPESFSTVATPAPSLSADGRFVAFTSPASNLVPGSGVREKLFVKDRVTGVISQASIGDPANGNQPANRDAKLGTISRDGRYAAFVTAATNAPFQSDGSASDAYLKDLQSGAVRLLSRNLATGGSPNSESFFPTFSGDGQYVAFVSSASNLVANDTNNSCDFFIVPTDGSIGTIRGSVADNGQQQLGSSLSCNNWTAPSLSGNGSRLAFSSDANGLVAGDTNNVFDVYVRDVKDGRTIRASIGATGASANSLSTSPALSGDGRFVVFSSTATNLVSRDTNGAMDVFRKNLDTGEILRVSTAEDGSQGNARSGGEAAGPTTSGISADGRYVTFLSEATNLVPDDTNGLADVFVKDLETGKIQRVSTTADGKQTGNVSGGGSFKLTAPAISSDGTVIAFGSNADDIVPNDTNNVRDVFAVEWKKRPIIPPTTTTTTTTTAITTPPTEPNLLNGAIVQSLELVGVKKSNQIIRLTGKLGCSLKSSVEPCAGNLKVALRRKVKKRTVTTLLSSGKVSGSNGHRTVLRITKRSLVSLLQRYAKKRVELVVTVQDQSRGSQANVSRQRLKVKTAKR